ncbi:TRAFAC clade GTPase domain-containing protein [Geodermatophilus sp. URMC 61]|uniref:TRAFAC clade GTPase domain-containing protein n=1 Tax=Geodermatophilus sp. URMC 61 TaxID=3423411 RepID=UPI00406C9EA4
MPYIIAFVVGALVVYMAVWIALALAVRALSFLLLYWMVAVTVAVVAGLLYGVTVPVRVLRGRGRARFRQLTPQDVADGTAFRAKVRGESRHYGWDRAWPTYFPYQAGQDAAGVSAECRDVTVRAWRLLARWCSIGAPGTAGPRSGSLTARTASAAERTARSAPGVVVGALVFPPAAGFTAGLWASVLAWLGLMYAIGLIVVAGQKLALAAVRWSDVLLRRRARAELRCPECYATSTLPSYRCSNPGCTEVHRALLPGPLGLRSRRCACGTTLPNTVRRAGARLTPVCPTCNAEMAQGSGNRQTVPVPVVGSVGAGKTRLLAAAAVHLEQRLAEVSGSVQGLTPEAETYLQVARQLVGEQASTTKTAAVRPSGVPLLLTGPDGGSVEVQLMDAAGESFQDWDGTSALRYLDQAPGLVFVLDPLPIPGVAGQLRSRGLAGGVLTAAGEQEESYAAAVDRMRAENVRLKERHLAVVLTKADILLALPAGTGLAGHDSGSVRSWLVDNDFDLLVQRCEKDFRTVAYFVVDSMSTDPQAGTSPLRVLEWVLTVCRSPVGAALARTPEPVGAGTTPEGNPA